MTATAGSPLDPQPPARASYREYAPSEKLRPFVECFWSRDPGSGRDPATRSVHRVLPDGCIDVVLGFSGEADEPESAMAVGTMTRALVLEGGAWPECFVGVRFRPGKATAFLAVPANELTDLRVPLDELWLDAGEVRDALSARAGAVERVRALERVLAARVSPGVVSAQNDVDEAIRRIVDAGGRVLAIGVGPSEKTPAWLRLTATGEPFEVHTEVDRETILSLLGGVRRRLGERWHGEFTVSADQHFAAWESEDRISGATGRNGDYFAYGFHLGIGYRFD